MLQNKYQHNISKRRMHRISPEAIRNQDFKQSELPYQKFNYSQRQY